MKIYNDNIKIIPIPNKRIKDLTGKKFNKLLVKGYVGKNEKNSALWLCMCECKKYKIVTTSDLKNSHVKSCGCLIKEALIERNKLNKYEKHGKSHTRIYKIWQGMKDRCGNINNKRFDNYGGRGIKYCKEWEDFIEFYNWAIHNGYNDSLTIDRIDVNGNYEPNNCRWITNKEQQNNKRYHHLIEHKGKIQNIAMWSEETGLSYDVIWGRIQDGWDVDKVLTSVVNKYAINEESDIKLILDLHYNKKYSARKIGRLYGVSHNTILNLLERNKKYE